MPLNMPTSWDEVFDGEAERPKTFLHDLYAPIMAAALGFGAIAAANWATRRPPLSGIQKHILFAGIMALGARTIDGYRSDYYAERDAVYRHYISLHPEDFPMPERKKYGELLQEWVPIR